LATGRDAGFTASNADMASLSRRGWSEIGFAAGSAAVFAAPLLLTKFPESPPQKAD